MSNLEKDTVKRVRKALIDVGLSNDIVEISETAHTAVDVAKALSVEVGAVVKTLTYTVGNRYVLALVAGNHQCKTEQLPRVLSLEGTVIRPTGDLVRAITGFPTGGISPIGLVAKLPMAIDASLKKFEKIYVSAGHSHCVFATTVDELKQLTGGVITYAVAGPKEGAKAEPEITQ